MGKTGKTLRRPVSKLYPLVPSISISEIAEAKNDIRRESQSNVRSNEEDVDHQDNVPIVKNNGKGDTHGVSNLQRTPNVHERYYNGQKSERTVKRRKAAIEGENRRKFASQP